MRTALELARKYGSGSKVYALADAIRARDEAWNRNINQNDAEHEAEKAALREQVRIAREALQIYVDNEGGTHMPAEEALRALTSLTPPPSPADEGKGTTT